MDSQATAFDSPRSDHAFAVANLPQHHEDPFDRLLIAQAAEEDLPIITGDEMFARYPIRT